MLSLSDYSRVLRLDPFSKDLNEDADKYDTRKEALSDAIKKLNHLGLNAVEFDLEGMIESV